ncbi:hypothetical protein [Neolewinella agarilytica]|nr:hypothetical protein [Neolewinella agarilytica]
MQSHILFYSCCLWLFVGLSSCQTPASAIKQSSQDVARAEQQIR